MRTILHFCRFTVLSLFAIATFLAPSRLHAIIDFQAPVQDELKMTSEPLAPGAPAIILQRILERNNAKEEAEEDNYYRIKILTEEGRKYANIQIPFDKALERVGYIKARTIQPDGTIKEVTEQAASKVVQKYGVSVQAMTLTVPDVKVGTIIEYQYATYFPRYWIPYTRWVITQDLFTKKARFFLGWNRNRFVYPVINFLPPGVQQPKYTDENGREGQWRVARLEAQNIPAAKQEDFSVPDGELKSRIDFLDFFYVQDRVPEKFWKKYGREKYEGMEAIVGKTGELQSVVAEIVGSETSPEAKLRKIYERVQSLKVTPLDTRIQEENARIEFSKSGKGTGTLNWLNEKTAARVLKEGAGDPIHLNGTFLALARAAGFEAYGVWTSSRRERFLRPPAMNSDQMDTTMVVVKLNGQDVFCEPGGTSVPFGMLPWTETGIKGLRLGKDGGTWIDIPSGKSADARVERVARLKVSPTGDLEGKLTVTYTGQDASERRWAWRLDDENGRKSLLENEIKAAIPGTSTIALTNTPDWTGTGPLVAEFTLKVSGFASAAGKQVNVPVGLFGAKEKSLLTPAERTTSIFFSYPSVLVDDVTLELAPGFKTVNLPQQKNVDGGVMKYEFRADGTASSVRMTRTFSNDELMLPATAYQALQNFFQIVKDTNQDKVVLQGN